MSQQYLKRKNNKQSSNTVNLKTDTNNINDICLLRQQNGEVEDRSYYLEYSNGIDEFTMRCSNVSQIVSAAENDC